MKPSETPKQTMGHIINYH